MKKLIISFLFSLMLTTVFAQKESIYISPIKKGNFLIASSLTFHRQPHKTSNGGFMNDSRLGYFFSDRSCSGLDLGFQYYKRSLDHLFMPAVGIFYRFYYNKVPSLSNPFFEATFLTNSILWNKNSSLFNDRNNAVVGIYGISSGINFQLTENVGVDIILKFLNNSTILYTNQQISSGFYFFSGLTYVIRRNE
jgi:hypothetical protein